LCHGGEIRRGVRQIPGSGGRKHHFIGPAAGAHRVGQ
jgi:hypothetical protein